MVRGRVIRDGEVTGETVLVAARHLALDGPVVGRGITLTVGGAAS